MQRVSLILVSALAFSGFSAHAATLLSARVGGAPRYATNTSTSGSAGLLNLNVLAGTQPASTNASTSGITGADVNANVGLGANVNAGSSVAPTVTATPPVVTTTTTASAANPSTSGAHVRAGRLLRVSLGGVPLLNVGTGTSASTTAADGSVACTVCLSATGGVGQ